MKLLIFGVLAVLLYNSPGARNTTGDILRKTADIVDTHQDAPELNRNINIQIPNPLHTTYQMNYRNEPLW